MSRIGKQPIEIPKGVTAEIVGRRIAVKGPKGKLEREVRPEISVRLEDGKLILAPHSDSPGVGAFHGLERALINNMVVGVTEGFSKDLELIGVGYRVDMKGNTLNLALGHSHPIDVDLPKDIKGSVIKEGREMFIRLEGADKQLVGQVAAQIIALRPPEPYKGKGVRHKGQVIKLKAGKAGKK
jgi:large subunit ribosomal protein L6